MPPPFGAEFGNGSLRQGLILSPASFFAPMNQRPATSSWSSTFTLDPEIHKKERACNARRMCCQRSCLITQTVGAIDTRAHLVEANCACCPLREGSQTLYTTHGACKHATAPRCAEHDLSWQDAWTHIVGEAGAGNKSWLSARWHPRYHPC